MLHLKIAYKYFRVIFFWSPLIYSLCICVFWVFGMRGNDAACRAGALSVLIDTFPPLSRPLPLQGRVVCLSHSVAVTCVDIRLSSSSPS